MEKWDRRFLDLAFLVASWSKDPSTKCGAVIVDNSNRVVSLGFNGFASGFEDKAERWDTRDFKYAHVIHAEENALLHAKQSLDKCKLYVTTAPCSSCMGKIVQCGIKEVVYQKPTEDFLARWAESLKNTKQIAKECNVVLRQVHF